MVDVEWIEHQIDMARRGMDECWIELETANTWEQIAEINLRLKEYGLRYKEYKAKLVHLDRDLTCDESCGSIHS